MRKYIFAIDGNGSKPSSSSISIPPAPSPSPSPSSLTSTSFDEHPSFYFPTIPIVDSAFDFATLTLIAGLILLSLYSFALIFHLKLKSRQSQHLQNFNRLWSIRLVLIFFIASWAVNEILRIPLFRRKYLYPFLPSFTIPQQANLCKVHVVMSLGLFEPGFLVTLLYLVNISIKNRTKSHMRSIASVFLMCLPIFIFQIIIVFLSPLEARLPMIMHRSSVIIKDEYGNKSVMCAYPMFSFMVFAAFGVCYSLGFMLSCWKVMAFVINKSIRVRINMLAFTVLTALPLEIFCLGLSVLWSPQSFVYGYIMLVMFLSVAISCVVGQFILVIKPTTEALAAGKKSLLWISRVQWSLREGFRDEELKKGRFS